MVDAVRIESRLELFVDRLLVDSLQQARFKLHEPQLASQVPSRLRGQFPTIIKDGDVYRGYVRRVAASYSPDKPQYNGHPGEMVCYLESRDGCEWVEPDLGLFEVDGSTRNNVILFGQPPYAHNFAPFRDANPATSARARFKALAGTHPIRSKAPADGLHAFESADGIRWQPMTDGPVITTEEFALDSQNVSFWSEIEKCYVCYFRTWKVPPEARGNQRAYFESRIRSISRTTSDDYLNWSAPVAMDPNLPGEHLYTSQTHPYFRAPHLYIALPTRYIENRGSSTDILFMTTRAGSNHFDRLFTQAFIRPGADPDRWGNRANYVGCGIVPTSDTEMSIYHGPAGLRYTLRIDGFVSLHAGAEAGEVITRPLIFHGSQLVLNYSTSAAGHVAVQLQNADGGAIPGFTLDDTIPLVGDAIGQRVQWKNNPNLAQLAGQPVRVRFALQEADVYSMQFR